MNIQVLGSGCAKCKKLYELTEEAVKQLKLNEKVEYVTDVARIIEMGVMSTPVLAVDGEPLMTGFVPSIDQIKEALTTGETKEEKVLNTCSCGDKC